jgi:hypothetical protein
MAVVSTEEIAELRELANNSPDDESLRSLDTQPVLLAYLIAWSRREGRDEVHDVELFCRASRFTQRELRECEAVLKPLGYIEVAKLLRKLSRLKRCQ